jgi:hypothetical protein
VSITTHDVERYLAADEPDYEQLARLGPEVLPHLEVLVRGSDPMTAAKAASLASLIRDPGAARVLEAASESDEVIVRIAAASGVRLLPPDQAGTALSRLLSDSDAEIRRIALESTPAQLTPDVRGALQGIARTDSYPYLRDLAGRNLRRRRRRR